MGEYPTGSPRLRLRARTISLLLFRGPNPEIQQTCEEGFLKFVVLGIVTSEEFKPRESDWQNSTISINN